MLKNNPITVKTFGGLDYFVSKQLVSGGIRFPSNLMVHPQRWQLATIGDEPCVHIN
jgi:hypothetical protein